MPTRILIVDDHGIVRFGLRRILENELGDVHIGEADSGEQAIALFRDQTWHLVILDIQLPGRSGLEVLKDLKCTKAATPVLALSMHASMHYARRMLRAGANGYLTKESAPEELGHAVRCVLRGRTYLASSIAEAMAGDVGGEGTPPAHARLTDRELEVLCALAAGQTTAEIADHLALSTKTVRSYRTSTLRKLGLKNNAELTQFALREHLIG